MAGKNPTPSWMAPRRPPRRKYPSVTTAQQAGASAARSFEAGADALDMASGNASPELQAAFEALRDGDDSLLMPYQPTPSINPPRPRTLAAGYDRKTETVYVRFRDGAVYAYDNVPARVWRNFKRVKSPGRAINRTLNHYEYRRLDV